MPAPSWENLNDFLDTGDFAVVGEVFINGKRARSIAGIFDEPSIDAVAGGRGGSYSYDTTGPTFWVRAVDAARINENDQIRIAGRVFDITRLPEVDGTGGAILRLSPVYGDGAR